MFKLLLKLAPGVVAISLRLIMVVGVICSAFTANAASATLTDSFTAPSAS